MVVTSRVEQICADVDAWRSLGAIEQMLRAKTFSDGFSLDIMWLIKEVEKWQHVATNNLYGSCWCIEKEESCTCPGIHGNA